MFNWLVASDRSSEGDWRSLLEILISYKISYHITKHITNLKSDIFFKIPWALERLLTPDALVKVLSSIISDNASHISFNWNLIALTASTLLSHRVAFSGFTVKPGKYLINISQR